MHNTNSFFTFVAMVIDDRKLINIAIDGHSSCGKSTVAKKLADELDYVYVDTGAMFRAVTLYAINNNLADEKRLDADGLIDALPEIHIELRNIHGEMRIFLNGMDVSADIRTMSVSKVVSPVSTVKEVRQKLLDLQQEMGKKKGVIMDGRDIGTVVFPDAELKIFLTASATVRAERRTQELIDRGQNVPYEEVYANLVERDFIDSNREIAPLKQAEDAILVDNSDLSLDQSLREIRALINQRLGH